MSTIFLLRVYFHVLYLFFVYILYYISHFFLHHFLVYIFLPFLRFECPKLHSSCVLFKRFVKVFVILYACQFSVFYRRSYFNF